MPCKGCGGKSLKSSSQSATTPGSFTKAPPSKSINTIELNGKRYQVVGKKTNKR